MNNHPAWYRGGVKVGLAPGIILPYDDDISALPPELEAWKPAGIGKKLLKYDTQPGQTGGSNATATTKSFSGGGNHRYRVQGRAVNTTGRGARYMTSGGHAGNHTHSGKVSFIPAAFRQTFVKILVKLDTLPLHCGFLSTEAIHTGFTETTEDLRFLGIDESVNKTVLEAQKASGVSVTAGGNHNHARGNYAAGGVPVPCTYFSTTGAHRGGNINATVDADLKAFCVSLWFAANANLDLPSGVYALFDGTTVPSGWKECNGTNGTIDLTDRFLKIDKNNLGKLVGTNTINITGIRMSHSAGHNNGSRSRPPTGNSGQHNLYGWSHSHSTSDITNEPFEPEFYTIKVIQAS